MLNKSHRFLDSNLGPLVLGMSTLSHKHCLCISELRSFALFNPTFVWTYFFTAAREFNQEMGLKSGTYRQCDRMARLIIQYLAI